MKNVHHLSSHTHKLEKINPDSIEVKKRSGSKSLPIAKPEPLLIFFKSTFWFVVGAVLGLFILSSFTYIFFQKKYENRIYPGIKIGIVSVGGKTQKEIKALFAEKNEKIGQTSFIFAHDDFAATISAKQLSIGYNENLLSEQAYSIGRSKDAWSNIVLMFQAYTQGIYLTPSYQYSDNVLSQLLTDAVQKFTIPPTEALFSFEDGKVVAFRPSFDGQEVDMEKLKSLLSMQILRAVSTTKPLTIVMPIPIKVVKPKITTDKANNLGVHELIGVGTSLFAGSIPSRIYNITLAASRMNGILIGPGETFSFDTVLGDVSSFTGYKQAYIIQNGRTVLGDGGGVCQVSTTLFRAILQAGLPVIERHAHAYRVGYYEQDAPPGLDATIYVPSVDLKFKNDTNHYILIQTFTDPNYAKLTFMLYGSKDGREVTIEKPVVSGQTPPPPPLYQDDPTLPKGEIKQVDYEASGAHVRFNRQVKKNGKVIITDSFVSNFRPWQAVYLRGTKE